MENKNQDPTEIQLEPKKLQPENHIDYFAPKIMWTTIALLLLVIVVGSVFWYQAIKETNSVSFSCVEGTKPEDCNDTVIMDETNQWKTYTNTDYGFEFKYPSSLTESKGRSFTWLGGLVVISIEDSQLIRDQIKVFPGVEAPAFIVKEEDVKEKMIDGVTAYYFTSNSATGCGGVNYRIPLQETKHLSLHFYHCPDEEESREYKSVEDFADQILSTFKFTSPKPLVSVRAHGGLCVTGMCDNTVRVHTDGAVYLNDRITDFKLTDQEMNTLETRIKNTNLAAIKNTKFTDTCPVAYDGQEYIFTFHTAEPTVTLASCQNVIPDSALFQSLVDLRSRMES